MAGAAGSAGKEGKDIMSDEINNGSESISICIDGTASEFHFLDYKKILDRFAGRKFSERLYLLSAAAEAKAGSLTRLLRKKGFSIGFCGEDAVMNLAVAILHATEECDHLALFANRRELAPLIRYLREDGVKIDLFGFQDLAHEDLASVAHSYTRLTEADRYNKYQASPATPPAKHNINSLGVAA